VELGLNERTVPAGPPDEVSATEPEKLLFGVIVTVYVVDVPRRIVRLDGETEIEKSAGTAATAAV
jgi:hypothetical protein